MKQLSSDIVLAEGDNELNVQMVPIAPPFDPWSYDFNGNGVIDIEELVAAANDYYAGIITKAELDQVTALWEATKPPPPECATQAQKDQAAADWQASLITIHELLRIQNLPLCP